MYVIVQEAKIEGLTEGGFKVCKLECGQLVQLTPTNYASKAEAEAALQKLRREKNAADQNGD